MGKGTSQYGMPPLTGLNRWRRKCGAFWPWCCVIIMPGRPIAVIIQSPFPFAPNSDERSNVRFSVVGLIPLQHDKLTQLLVFEGACSGCLQEALCLYFQLMRSIIELQSSMSSELQDRKSYRICLGFDGQVLYWRIDDWHPQKKALVVRQTRKLSKTKSHISPTFTTSKPQKKNAIRMKSL